MKVTRKGFLTLSGAGAAAGAGLLSACSSQQAQNNTQGSTSVPANVDLNEFESLALDASKWQYDATNDIYYQLGLTYCKKPASKSLESLAIFVPGKFFTAEKNGDTYTCTVDTTAVVGSFTAATAPVLLPINSGVLSAQQSPTAYGYAGLLPYMQAGCIYVYAGFRGRSAGYDSSSDSKELFAGGSPWPLVDLKAAVRYLRYNASKLPIHTERIFTFGFDQGGGLAALLGATGGAPEYDSYLTTIGAVTHDAKGQTISDNIMGVCCWCPNTSFDEADAALEWSAGQFSTAGQRADGTWTQQLSRDLAAHYGTYINAMDFRNAADEQLTLSESPAGAFTEGSYADALVASLESAAATFASKTSFPYTYTPARLEAPSFPGDPNLAVSRAAASTVSAAKPSDGSATTDANGQAAASGNAASAPAATTAHPTEGASVVQSTVYTSLESYLSSLNIDGTWITHSSKTGRVSIDELKSFTTRLRQVGGNAPAFDQTERGSSTNQLFGINETSTLHFSTAIKDTIAQRKEVYATLGNWNEVYATAWQEDLERVDAQGKTIAERVNMMNPLYYLSGAEAGFGTATPASKWRINEGAFNPDTSLCTSANLALALSHTPGVTSMDYALVWGQGHVLAEVEGSAAGNMLNWVLACLVQE